jgi:hypothetical protein
MHFDAEVIGPKTELLKINFTLVISLHSRPQPLLCRWCSRMLSGILLHDNLRYSNQPSEIAIFPGCRTIENFRTSISATQLLKPVINHYPRMNPLFQERYRLLPSSFLGQEGGDFFPKVDLIQLTESGSSRNINFAFDIFGSLTVYSFKDPSSTRLIASATSLFTSILPLSLN